MRDKERQYQRGILKAGSVFKAANESIPFFEDGDDLPCIATVAITGKRLVQISAARQGTISTGGSATTPDTGLDTTASGQRFQVAMAGGAGTAGAGKRVLGVALWDAAIGQEVTVKRGSVMLVTCAANITAGQEVEVDANGKVIPLNAGVAVGMALDTTASGGDATILMYK